MTEPTSIAANAAYLSIAEVASKVASIALYVVMAREVGAAGFGVYTFGLAAASLVTTLGGFGQATVLTREVSRDRSRLDEFFGNTVGLMVVLTVPVVIVTAIVLAATGRSSAERVVFLLLSLAVTADLLTAAMLAVFQAFERLAFAPAVLIPERTLTAGGGIVALVVFHASVVTVAVMAALAAVVALGLAVFFLVTRVARPSVRIEPSRWVSLMRAAAPVGVAGVLFTVMFRVDVAILAAFKATAVVGAYGAAYRLLEATLFLSWSVTGAAYPVLSRLADDDPEIGSVFARSLKTLVVLTLPAALGALVLARGVIALLYGHGFRSATTALALLAPTIALYPVSYLAGYLLVARHRQRVVTVAYALGAGFNLVANLVAIPRWSLNGAAAVTSLTQAVVVAAMAVPTVRLTRAVRWLPVVGGPVVAGAFASAVMLALRDQPVVAAAAAGAVTYLTTLTGVEWTRSPADVRALLHRLARRPAPGRPATTSGTPPPHS